VSLCLLVFGHKGLNALILVLLFLFVSALIAYLVLAIIVKKKERLVEIEKLKVFFDAKLLDNPEVEYVLPRAESAGVVYLTFKDKLFTIDNVDYLYDNFECALYTSNYKYQVNLIIVFTAKVDENNQEMNGEQEEDSSENDNKVKEFSLPLNLNLLSVMNKFNLQLINPDVLKFIKENPKIATKQIMKYGKIQTDFYNVN